MNAEEEVTVTLRCPAMLRDAFDRACAANDRTKSQVLRDFMREYVQKQQQGKLL